MPTKNKREISLSFEEDILEWMKMVSEKERISVSYIINRYCTTYKKSRKLPNLDKPKKGNSNMPNKPKKGISLTLDKDLIEWLDAISRQQKLSISYIVNKFCVRSRELAEKHKTLFPMIED